MHISDDLVIARPIQNGYSWTLASRLGEMIDRMENQFGARNRDWTILGIEFNESGPRIWFPGNRPHIVIQLGIHAAESVEQAIFQMSQECIHTLTPKVGSASVFEEGLSIEFALGYMRDVIRSNITCNNEKYVLAHRSFLSVQRIDPNCVRTLRTARSVMSDASFADFKRLWPNLPDQDCETLTQQFDTWRPI